MVYVPEKNLIFSGDAVYCNEHPSMAQAETKEWLEALNHLRKMSVDVIVPGHGASCDKEVTYRLSEYIRDMRAMVRRSFQAGRSKSETSSAVISEFMDAFDHSESEKERVRQVVKGGSDRIYDEYRAAAKATSARARQGSPRSRSRRRRRRTR
jgi:cyclase